MFSEARVVRDRPVWTVSQMDYKPWVWAVPFARTVLQCGAVTPALVCTERNRWVDTDVLCCPVVSLSVP